MVEIARGWSFDVERGPNLLIIKLHADDVGAEGFANLADCLWNVLDQHLIYRAVIDCQAIDSVSGELVDQFVDLGDRIVAAGGMLRLCGFEKKDVRRLQAAETTGQFACYPTCAEAISESHSRKPR